MQYDTIFFDVGNTLFFFNYDFLRELFKHRFELSFSSAEIEEKHIEMKRSIVRDGLVGRMDHEELWWESYRRWFSSLGIENELVRPISETIRSHPFTHLFWSRMEEGTPEMLDWFRERGFKLGVVSNAEGQIRRLIEHAHLEGRFDAIVDSGVVGIAKPDSRIFEHALKIVGADAARSVHVGDLMDVDVAGARAAGITPVLVDREGLNPGIDCLTVRRVADLPRLPIFSEGSK